MSNYARHLPTQIFTLADINAMPRCFGPAWLGAFAPENYSLWRDSRGKLIVTYVPPFPESAALGAYSVRPVIRVPAVTRKAA